MVHQMGAERAGTYWDLADMALKGELLEDNAPVNDHLRVSRHFVRSIPGDSDKDQRMVLRIQVEALSKEPIDYRRMYLQVFFYDIVNESRFEQTIADTLPSYISAPYDWKDGEEEIIEVEYHLPELSAGANGPTWPPPIFWLPDRTLLSRCSSGLGGRPA